MDSTSGRLLVATPQIREPTFHRSVVLMLEHNAEGALGVVINRPTDRKVGDVLEDWGPYASEPGVIFTGGPVDPTAAICLAFGGQPGVPTWAPVLDDLGVIDLGRDPADVGVRDVRVFVGYAGWASGQLDAELETGSWYTVDARTSDARHPSPEDLWREVLGRQPGELGWMRNFPLDESLN